MVSLEVHTNTYTPLHGSKHRIVTMRKLLAAKICLALSSQQLYALYLINKCVFFYVYVNQE